MNKSKILCIVFMVSFLIFPSIVSAENKGAKISIGAALFNFGVDSYETAYYKFMTKKAKEIGIDLVLLDAGGDPSVQANQVDNLIQKKVAAIIIWPVSGKAIVPAAKRAKEAGIPVVISNSPIAEEGFKYVVGYTGPDDYKMGTLAGKMMCKALKKGNVVEITGLPGYVTSDLRSSGIHDGLSNCEINILDSQPGDWERTKAQRVMETFIVKYGSKIEGVVLPSDPMGMGVIEALKEAGMMEDTIITSMTFISESYDALKRGEIYSSVWQDPTKDADLALKTAINAAKGIMPKSFKTYFETPLVTSENLEEIGRPPF